MNIEEVLFQHNKLDLPRPKILRSYETFRERTVREFGADLAYEIDGAIAAIFEVILLKIAGDLSRVDAVAIFQNHGWRPVAQNELVDHFARYHDFARIAPNLERKGHSQFENAFFLESLNSKHFEEVGIRTTILGHPKLPSAMVAISDLGDLPQPEFAFGLKAVFPHYADYLLWWAVRCSPLWSYFANPSDLGTNSWSVANASSVDDRIRPFAKVALGAKDHRLGPSNNEERFYAAAFVAPETDQKLEILEGTYLAYHVL